MLRFINCHTTLTADSLSFFFSHSSILTTRRNMKYRAEIVDYAYLCPYEGCELGYFNPKSLQRHGKRTHDIHIITHQKKQLSLNQTRRRQAGYSRTYQQKKNAKKRPKRKKKKPVYSKLEPEDADKRGVYGCDSPLVECKKSLIEGGGNGVFALQNFAPNDIVSWFAGEFNNVKDGTTYSLQLSDGRFFNCIRTPEIGKGLAGFINREERTMKRSRKNCEIVECPSEKNKLYIEITKNVKAGKELYTTYSRGYRIKK